MTFSVDGVDLGAPDTGPYSAIWDTRPVANGPHTIRVTARDAAGNSAFAEASSRSTTAALSILISWLPTASTKDRARHRPMRAATATEPCCRSRLGSGKTGSAVSLDGIDDRVDLPALGTFYNTAFTLEAWVWKSGSRTDVAVVGAWDPGSGGPMIWVDHINGHYMLTLGSRLRGLSRFGNRTRHRSLAARRGNLRRRGRANLRGRRGGGKQKLHRRRRHRERMAHRCVPDGRDRQFRRPDRRRADLPPRDLGRGRAGGSRGSRAARALSPRLWSRHRRSTAPRACPRPRPSVRPSASRCRPARSTQPASSSVTRAATRSRRTVQYVSSTRTAILTPSNPLAGNARYVATVKGGPQASPTSPATISVPM